MTLVTLCHFPLELVEEVFEEHDVVLSLFGYRNPLAHPRGYAHRDLKPANILFTKAGNKLLDLGLAKLQRAGALMPRPEVSECVASWKCWCRRVITATFGSRGERKSFRHECRTIPKG